MTHRHRLVLLVLLLVSAGAGAALAAGVPAAGTADRQATPADVALLVTYILLALVFSFLCSIAEAALLSITPSYVAGLQDKHPRRARMLKRLKQDNIDQSLAAILTLNTIAHTVGAIGSGAKATVVFGSAWFGLFSAVMTLLILFLSEIIPKTLGAVYWRRLAAPTAIFVRGLILVLYPLIWVSERLTRLIAGRKGAHGFNREEFLAMAAVGAAAGHIDEHESGILRNLFRMRSVKAHHVMTPRTVVVGLPETMTVAEAVERDLRFSRIPIFARGMDDVHGMVLKDDILLAHAEGKGERPLIDLKRDILAVPGSAPLSALLETLLDQRQHIALVVDEYGGTTGLVTLEDVVETLLGKEIVDESDTDEDMQVLARKHWERRAKTLGLDAAPPQEPGRG